MGRGLGRCNFPLLFLVCSADLFVPRSGPSSHHVKLYSVIFMHTICTRVVCVSKWQVSRVSESVIKGGEGGGGGRGKKLRENKLLNVYLKLN